MEDGMAREAFENFRARLRSKRSAQWNVAPRFTPGSPALVDEATAYKVAAEERSAYEPALAGVYGKNEQDKARDLEPEVLVAFERFVAKLRASAAGPPPVQKPIPPAAETIAKVRSHLTMLAGVDLALRKACDSYALDSMKNVQMEKAIGDWAVGTAKAAADFMVLGGGQEVTDAAVLAMRAGLFILARFDAAGFQIVQPGGPADDVTLGGEDGTEF